MKRLRNTLSLAVLLASPACGSTAGTMSPSDPGSPLVEQRSIALPDVAGRIDHLAVDVAHHRVFVAELGNGSVDVVDLDSGASRRISGLKEPQGLAYLPDRNELVVTNGGDGTVQFYDAASLSLNSTLKLGNDADNLLVDPATGFVAVGYGSGAIAFIDPAQRRVVERIELPAHPEGFRLDQTAKRLFVNLPGAGLIAAANRAGNQPFERWRATHQLNFPMAIDHATHSLAVVYRRPSRLVLLDAQTGAVRDDLSTCGDADDVFVDASRKRLYVICGSGAIGVFQKAASGYTHVTDVVTAHGARTGLFIPELDELVVASHANGSLATLLVFSPFPRSPVP